MEYVGMAELDETCYRGEPGGKEPVGVKELLRLVQTWPEEKLGQKIAEKKDWNVLYHLTSIRGNLVEWLPIEQTDSVLEIGSECGALTVALGKKAGHLDCIEESKAKSMVNATRNQNNEHISIKTGNFFDVEHRLRGEYDWVIVAGLPEYVENQADFLRRAAALLKERGRLVLATENRLGLKYFAGCAEERTGRLFEGIEGYHHQESAKTFSRPELEKLLDEAGLWQRKFYYPYPDYKLPMSIYSDEYLPKLGELRTNQNNFDFRRLQLFDESEAFDGVIQSGLFSIFSNAFLVIVQPGDAHELPCTRRELPSAGPAGRIIFTKYSNERAKSYALRTDIVEDEGRKYVKKCAMYPQGEAHIRDIEYYYQVLNRRYQDSRIRINRCGRSEDGVILEYLEGKTLEELLDGYLLEGKIELLIEHLFEYLEEVKKGFTKEQFVLTPEFEKVFGRVTLPENLLSADVADVDMVLNNVIVDGEWKLIDYEWSFNFPIPYHFVVYRILHYYLHSSSTRNVLLGYGLMEKAGLTLEEIAVYEQMELHFQKVYVVTEKDGSNQHIPLRSLYEDMTPGTVDLKALGMDEEVNRRQHLVQLYQAPDLNFSEEHSEIKTLYKEGIFLDGFSIDPASRCVRLDPASCYCIVRRLQMQWGREITHYRTNGITMADGALLFSVDDPQIIVEKPAEGGDSFRAYFEIEYLSADDALYLTQNALGKVKRQLQDVQNTLRQREELIHSMENTRVWKAYRKIKKQ